MKLNCPVYVEAIDDLCGLPIEIDAYPGEPRTHWYPGSDPGFIVTNASCEHAGEIEEYYYDEIMFALACEKQNVKERAEEYRHEQWETYDWQERFSEEIGGEA